MILESTSPDAWVKLEIIEHANTHPEHLDSFRMKAQLTSAGFVGNADFWVMKPSLHHFAQELRNLHHQLSGQARLQCGWGDDVLFAMHCFPFDALGHLRARVEAATNLGFNRWHRVVVELEVEPESVGRFAKSIETSLAA